MSALSDFSHRPHSWLTVLPLCFIISHLPINPPPLRQGRRIFIFVRLPRARAAVHSHTGSAQRPPHPLPPPPLLAPFNCDDIYHHKHRKIILKMHFFFFFFFRHSIGWLFSGVRVDFAGWAVQGVRKRHGVIHFNHPALLHLSVKI